MTWNHRVLRRDDGHGPYFAVHEVYYNAHGVPDKWTVTPIDLVNETIADMREEVAMIQRALDAPVLEEAPDGKTLREVL